MLKRWEVINNLIEEFSYDSYLEIGVAHFTTFNQVCADHKECVDPNVTTATYHMTSDRFFNTSTSKREWYDLIFIDGMHTYEQSWRDLQNSLNILSVDGTVVLHDCNPYDPQFATVNWIPGTWLGEVWKTILSARICFPRLHIYTLPDDEGCGIINYTRYPVPLRKNLAQLSLEQVKLLPYEFLVDHRKDILNLWEP